MVYHLLYPLKDFFFIFNVTKYITFRSAGALLTSFLVSCLFWKFILRRSDAGPVPDNEEERIKRFLKYYSYDHTRWPLLVGGPMLVLFACITVLIWVRWDNYLVWMVMVVMVLLGGTGLCESVFKKKKNKRLSCFTKTLLYTMPGLILGVIIVLSREFQSTLHFPFFKNAIIELGCFYIIWSILIVIFTSQSVKETKDLPGFEIQTLIVMFFVFGILSYIAEHVEIANYLFLPYIPGAGELSVFCCSLAGASLGFWWYNCFPGQIFLGKTGVLAFGGAVAAIALLIKQEFIIFIGGGIFVAERLSVVLQRECIRQRGRKLFNAVPLHNHFAKGLKWKEKQKIVVRFLIVSVVLGIFALITVKIR